MQNISKEIRRDPFAYAIEFINLAANAQANGAISVSADSDFEIWKITGTQTGEYTIRITDTGSGRDFMDRAISSSNIVGTAQRPFILPIPKLIRRNSSLTIQVLDISGALNTIRLTFWGIKNYI